MCLLYNLCRTSRIQNSIQYTKIAQGAPSSSYLPLKVNPAGVIPVIFASSITAAPAAIFQVISVLVLQGQDGLGKQLKPCWLQTHQLVWQCMPY